MVDSLVGLDAERLDMRGPVDQLPGHVGLQARDGRQWREIGRCKRGEVARRHFGRAVPSEQLVIEKQADLGNHEVAGNDQRSQ